jgi:hypothetical protein
MKYCALVNCQIDCLKGRNRMIKQNVVPCQRPSEGAPYESIEILLFNVPRSMLNLPFCYCNVIAYSQY